ncbi:apoptosis-associated speck-like protein containing a CARD [Discoglossus pictus]
MAGKTTGSRLQDILDDMTDKDFKKFKDQLNSIPNAPNGKPIPRSKLENADRLDTKNMLIQHYTAGKAPEITHQVLEHINLRQLAEDLRKLFPEIFPPYPNRPVQDTEHDPPSSTRSFY